LIDELGARAMVDNAHSRREVADRTSLRALSGRRRRKIRRGNFPTLPEPASANSAATSKSGSWIVGTCRSPSNWRPVYRRRSERVC